jgi:hypothetical protein
MALDGFARVLEILARGESVPASRIAKSTLEALRSLIESGAVTWQRSGAGSRLVVQDVATVGRFMAAQFPSGTRGIDDLELSPKATAVANFADAHRGVSDKSVVLLRGFGDMRLDCGGTAFPLQPISETAGLAAIVVADDRPWSARATIGLVENLELFLEAERTAIGIAVDAYIYYGGRMPRRVLAWLASSEMAGCRLIHLPDYDPVGLDSFLSLAASCPERAELHVPINLRELTDRYGKASLLTDSPDVWRRVRSTENDVVREVVTILNDLGKGLEQEALLVHERTEARRARSAP